MSASVYVIEGPSGVYVGCTANAESRRRAHWGRAAKPASHADQMIHIAMRRDGIGLYSFRIVATFAHHGAASNAERALIVALRAEGKRVLNVYPLTAAHHAPRSRGRYDYVVLGGERQAL